MLLVKNGIYFFGVERYYLYLNIYIECIVIRRGCAEDTGIDNNPIEAVDIYSDNGFTGMNFSRPGFRRMLSDIRDGVINCVIVKDISRLGRHFVLTSELAEKILPEMNVRLISINDGYDSIKKDA